MNDTLTEFISNVIILKPFYLKVVDAPKRAKDLLKTMVCAKKIFPYGDPEHKFFYDPTCVIDHKSCKEVCGKKCKEDCKKQHTLCARGKPGEDFLFCSSRSDLGSDIELPYVQYKYVKETNVKEGKNPYTKMEKFVTDLEPKLFISKLVEDFPKFSEHQIIAWFLSNAKNAAFASKNVPDHMLTGVSDFAQNLLHIRKHETAEEYFKRPQTALHGTVSGISKTIINEDGSRSHIGHHITQFTSSDYRFFSFCLDFQLKIIN